MLQQQAMLASRQAGWAVGGEWTLKGNNFSMLSLQHRLSSTEMHSPCCSSRARTAYATSTASAAAAVRRSSPAAATGAAWRQQVPCPLALRSRSASYQLAAPQRLTTPHAADAAQADGQDEDGALPLWRFLRQQGFSADGINRMQAAVRSGRTNITTSQKFTAQKLQRDLAPAIAALRAEGLDIGTIEQLFQAYPPAAHLNAHHRQQQPGGASATGGTAA